MFRYLVLGRRYNSVTKAGCRLVTLEGALSSKLHQVAFVKKKILSCKVLIVHMMIWLSFAMPSLLVVDICEIVVDSGGRKFFLYAFGGHLVLCRGRHLVVVANRVVCRNRYLL